MTTKNQQSSDFRATAEIKLLKTTKVTPDGHRFHNLYLQVNGGNPIAIKLSFEDKDYKKKNLLLAVATPCEIKTSTLVREVPHDEGTEDF